MKMPETTCDIKQLTFSIDRILAKDVAPISNSTIQYPSSAYSTQYSFTESYKTCSFLENNINRPSNQNSQFHVISDNYGHIFRNSSNVIRPAPLRAIPKECTSSSSSTTRMETTSCRRRSWSRAVFSSLQRKGLEKRFALQKYITKPDRRQLAATLGLTDAQVKVWFQNRRMKWRHMKEDKKINPSGDDVCKSDRNLNSSESAQYDVNLAVGNEYSSDEDVDVESNS